MHPCFLNKETFPYLHLVRPSSNKHKKVADIA